MGLRPHRLFLLTLRVASQLAKAKLFTMKTNKILIASTATTIAFTIISAWIDHGLVYLTAVAGALTVFVVANYSERKQP